MFRSKQSVLGTALTLAFMMVTSIAALGQNAPGDLLITLGDPPSVLRYSPVTGTPLGYFVTPDSGGIELPQTLTYGPDGNLYVASFGSRNILRYNGKTGALIDVFVPIHSGGLGGPYGVTFGPDDNLYVTSYFFASNPGVLRYDGTTGVFIDLFVAGVSMSTPAFSSDGDLYVSGPSGILRYDGLTGQPFPAPGHSGAFFAAGDNGPITFGPNGDLFVTSQCRNVLRYDGTTGAFISTFVTAGQVPLPFDQCIAGMAFGPDRNLYLIGYYSTVYRYDGETGAFINSYGTGLRGTTGLTFTPFPTSKAQCIEDGWRTFDFRNQGQCIKFVNASE
ncbi:MAG TPA: hypothetical protein VFR78_01510 [Pyrinomonadaceae bacterium]|nr:hypothetical protein [Pyrinomonadaceae bacterium]